MNRRDFIAKTAGGSALLVGGQRMGGVGSAFAGPKIQVGYGVGQKAPVISGPDHYQRSTSLRSYAGGWTLLDVAAWWCLPCLDTAGNHLAFVEYVNGEGIPLKVLTIVAQALNTAPSTQRDAERWALKTASLGPRSGLSLRAVCT